MLLTRLSGGRLRPPVGWAAVTGVGRIAGIGFTVSILIATLAFSGAQLQEAKLGVLSPKLRLVGLVITAVSWGFCCCAGPVFWLLQGERDGDADEVECLALVTGGLGEHGGGGGSAGEADLVAGGWPGG